MKLGIIGGSGLDDPSLFQKLEEITVDTPYGPPSSSLITGTLEETEVVFLSRHGREHTIPPCSINSRANLWALREQGVDSILATAACGSLREEMDRGHLVLPDQFIDFTRHRPVTFHEQFEPGIMNAVHVPMAEPFDSHLRTILAEAASTLEVPTHTTGTLLTIEGNRFSTRAESNMFRMWGADLVNMTVAPEVILANELALPYAAVAVVTDYDCWKTDEPPLKVEDLVKVFTDNVETLNQVLLEALRRLTPASS
jgi:5'-methylthioadenosine phosphorylase